MMVCAPPFASGHLAIPSHTTDGARHGEARVTRFVGHDARSESESDAEVGSFDNALPGPAERPCLVAADLDGEIAVDVS